MTVPFDLQTFIIAAATVGAAYVAFGVSAFGAALFTVPILSHFFPLAFVLPLAVLLDVSAALALGARFSRAADKSELMLLTPFSLAGAVLGVTLLGEVRVGVRGVCCDLYGQRSWVLGSAPSCAL